MTKGAKQFAQLFEKPSQRDVAKRLEIDESYVSLLVSGQRTPSLQLAARIQEELGIPIDAWVEEVRA